MEILIYDKEPAEGKMLNVNYLLIHINKCYSTAILDAIFETSISMLCIHMKNK